MSLVFLSEGSLLTCYSLDDDTRVFTFLAWHGTTDLVYKVLHAVFLNEAQIQILL